MTSKKEVGRKVGCLGWFCGGLLLVFFPAFTVLYSGERGPLAVSKFICIDRSFRSLKYSKDHSTYQHCPFRLLS